MTIGDVTIVGPRTGLGVAARAVLDTVPEWFGRHANNTTLHLAEHRAGMSPTVSRGVALCIDGQRRWVTYDDLLADESDFEMIGTAFESSTGLERTAALGAGLVRTVPARPLVDFAVEWMREHRADAGPTQP